MEKLIKSNARMNWSITNYQEGGLRFAFYTKGVISGTTHIDGG
jgi:hypothetical protein